MAQQYVRLQGPTTPFRLHFRSSPAAIVEAAADLTLVWSDGTTETMPRGTRPVLQSDLSMARMDATLGVWMVVAVQTKPTQPLLIQEKDYEQIDTLVTQAWAVLYRVTHTLEQWQQA